MVNRQAADAQSPGARGWVWLAVSIAVPLAVGALGGLATDASWYLELRRPAFAPPGWIFGPVWTLLYVCMGVAAWWVWRAAGWRKARGALALYGAQLVLNALWSPIFFGMHAMGWALVDILLMIVAITATLVAFWRIKRGAGMLMIPYLLWVAFATVLNWSLWSLNP